MSGLSPLSGSRRSTSRTPSMVSVGRMPIISEDEAHMSQPPPTRPPHRRATSMPAYSTTNLRRPSSISNRGNPNRRSTPAIPERSNARPSSSHGPARPATSAGSAAYGSTYPMAHGGQIPPYPPPEYYPRLSRDRVGRSTLRSGGDDLPDRNPPLKDEYSNMEKIRENPWVAKRGGWRRILLIIAIIVVILAALAIGLTLGLKDRSSSSSDTTTDNSPPVFPAGSFAFQAALTNVSTSCTADPATWRCYPYITYADAASSSSPSDAAASFFWTILGPDARGGRHGYAISSADNPFAPRFGNVSMTMRDGNTPDERLVFSVEMNRTVVPGAAMEGFADDVSCEFASVFTGTVWTGRVGSTGRERGNVTADESHRGKSRAWDPWPGEVEVLQTADGAPRCANARGDEIPVEFRRGECLCRYANFDLGEGGRNRRRWLLG